RKAFALDWTRNMPLNLMGRALYLRGQPAEAMKVFGDSIKLGLTPGAPRWLPCGELRAGRRDEALATLREDLRSGSPLTIRQVAETYSCLGDSLHALEAFEK